MPLSVRLQAVTGSTRRPTAVLPELGRPGQALIIDDCRVMRTILVRIVSQLGFEPVVATHGQHALELLQAGLTPSLCLIDWNMPVMDGFTFVTTVRQNPAWCDIVLVMVTAGGSRDLVVRALAAGAHAYLTKPFTHDAIARQLDLLGVTTAAVSA